MSWLPSLPQKIGYFFTTTIPNVLGQILQNAFAPQIAAINLIKGVIQQFGPQIMGWLGGLWSQFQSWLGGIINGLVAAFNAVKTGILSAFANLQGILTNLPSLIGSGLRAIFSPWTAILNTISGGVQRAANFLGNLKWPSWLGGGGGNTPTPGGAGGTRTNTRPKAKAKGEPGKGFSNLDSAVNYEMKNKPPGSDLVVANSSETVIPAAGGYGAQELFATLQQGFANTKTTFERISQGVNINRQDMLAGFKQSEQKDTERANATNGRIDKYQQTTASQIAGIGQNVASLAAKVKEMSSFGGMMGGMGGGAGGAAGAGGAGGGMATGSGYGSKGSQIAGQLGTYIKQTGGAPGSIHEHPQHGGVKGKHSPNSYHYQGRAIDIGAYAYEQGGVLSRIAQFNQKMGVKPVELLKAGDPGHNDHVHVAYAFGKGNPALFSSKQAAQKFEKSMVPSSVKVGSITGNSAEGFGGSTSVTNNITIQQLPGQSADELAMIVANKISEAVADARAASILV
jgi:hypothetical protein